VTLHDDARRLLAGWRAPDSRQERLRQEYVAHLDAHADGLERTCLPDHVTASTVVLSPAGDQVLLTLHAKAGAWFQLGGHTEPDDLTLAGAALREAREESGLGGLSMDPEPVQLDRHEVPFCGGRPGTRHLDVRFLAVAAPGTGHTVSEESLDVRWWPADRLPGDEPSLRELVDLGRDRLRRGVRLERL
jgi:8-oxo-dGTP pyrophosphatase MutT (NUDIX family)